MPDATFFAKNLMKKLAGSKKSSTFASAKNKAAHFGVLVQLVRMPACHAGGHGFETRRYRQIQLCNWRSSMCWQSGKTLDNLDRQIYIVGLCNGSTADFDSASEGSKPSPTAILLDTSSNF